MRTCLGESAAVGYPLKRAKIKFALKEEMKNNYVHNLLMWYDHYYHAYDPEEVVVEEKSKATPTLHFEEVQKNSCNFYSDKKEDRNKTPYEFIKTKQIGKKRDIIKLSAIDLDEAILEQGFVKRHVFDEEPKKKKKKKKVNKNSDIISKEDYEDESDDEEKKEYCEGDLLDCHSVQAIANTLIRDDQRVQRLEREKLERERLEKAKQKQNQK